VGDCIDVGAMKSESLIPMIRKVLADASYRDNAIRFKKIIRDAQGLDVAADAIEQAFDCA
jgi:UDP:flavonoid glycosyltransferase YjiC (YdhE family)